MDYGPIDGTSNLVKQQEDYCIILGYFVDGEPKLSYIYDYPHQHLYKAIENEGAFDNDQAMKQPIHMDIKKQYSFNTQVMNDETIHQLYDASFSHRIIGSCGLDSIRVIKVNLVHISIPILNLGILQHNFYLRKNLV